MQAGFQPGSNFFVEAQRRFRDKQPYLNKVINGYVESTFAKDLHFWPYCAVLLVHEALERPTGFLPRISKQTADLIQPALSLEKAAGKSGTFVREFWKEQPYLLLAVEELAGGLASSELQDDAWRYALLTYHHLRVEASLAGWNHCTEAGEEQSLPQLSSAAVSAVMASFKEQGREAFFDGAQARMERYQPDYFLVIRQAITKNHPQEAQEVLRPLMLLYEIFEHYGDNLRVQMNFNLPDLPPS
jgi:hypothetical protein